MPFAPDPQKYDNTCYIVAGGPSLKTFRWSLLTPDKFVVAINRAYEVLPDAQIVYFTDRDFMKQHLKNMVNHKGQLIRGALTPKHEPTHPRVEYYKLTSATGLETKQGCLRHGHNSTYAVLNLVAAHYGFKKVYLLGVDMKWGAKGDKGTSHWHSGHRRVDSEQVYTRMKTAFNSIAPPLKKLGVEVYNVNPDSGLDLFPKVSVDQVFK
jgi:hypothetical protein